MGRLFVLIISILIVFAGYAKATHRDVIVPVSAPVVAPVKKDGTGVIIRKTIPKRGVRAFMSRISHMESKNNCKAVNSLGMLGCYQFDPRTIRAMGFKVDHQEFLNNRDIQDKVMLAFMKDNKRSLRKIIQKYDGKVVNGVEVTESGVLASAHLAGVGGVLSWFYPEKYGKYRTYDDNGASVQMYMKKFAHYDMRGL